MPKALVTEDALAAIHAIRQSPEKYDLKRDLAPFLRHKSNHVIAAAAASIAERLEAAALAPDLVQAFEKLMRDPAKLDQGCKATIAIVQALIQLEDPAAKVYFSGIRHVQSEGSFGPPVDAAAPLRGLCARGLARMGHPDALLECVTLLADPEIRRAPAPFAPSPMPGVRKASCCCGLRPCGRQGNRGDGRVFRRAAEPGPGGSVPFVAKFLNPAGGAIGEQAALALGESRLPAAFEALREAWERGGAAEQRRTLLVAIAMLRIDEALEFLLGRLAEESGPVAADALAGLAFYARDEAVLDALKSIIGQRGDGALEAVFAREFRRAG